MTQASVKKLKRRNRLMSTVDRNDEFKAVLKRSLMVQEILNRAADLDLPNWYLGGGVIAQTVWNSFHKFPLDTGIKDCDLIYFDTDLSWQKEDSFIRRGAEVFNKVPVPVEIKNQARVHLWYKEKFGYDIAPYSSSEAAIDAWPTTATSIAIRKDADGELVVYASFGLDDLFNLVVRPNKRQITEDIYLKKVNRWTAVWPRLKIVPWNE